MEITGPGGISGPRKVQSKKINASAAVDAPAPSAGADKAEFSEAARFLQGLETVASARIDKIRDLRQQIERGEYETPERLSRAIDRLLEDITG